MAGSFRELHSVFLTQYQWFMNIFLVCLPHLRVPLQNAQQSLMRAAAAVIQAERAAAGD
jgi:hypothetical protein